MTMITPASLTNANPGPALYAIIETAMLADGWTLVDTVTIGGNTHKVLKSAAAGNVQGLDWYLDINYTTAGAGTMRFFPMESYDAVGHNAVRGAFGCLSVTTIDATTYSRFGATGSALETNWANTSSSTQLSMTISTTAFQYWISVTRNRIIAMTTNNAQQIYYAGFFTPSAAFVSNSGASMFPLIQAVLNSNVSVSQSTTSLSSCTAQVTRVPKLLTMTSQGWAQTVAVQTYPVAGGPNPEGQIGTAVSPFTGRNTLVPLPVWFGQGSTPIPSYSTPTVDYVGTIDDVCMGYADPTNVRGNTVTVGSDTWYVTSNNSSGTCVLAMKGV